MKEYIYQTLGVPRLDLGIEVEVKVHQQGSGWFQYVYVQWLFQVSLSDVWMCACPGILGYQRMNFLLCSVMYDLIKC